MGEASFAEGFDPRGLIREAYRIEGIDAGQCRSVFLDWLLGAAEVPDQATQIAALLAHHAADAPDHPMSLVLREALAGAAEPRGRRGGWRGRRRD